MIESEFNYNEPDPDIVEVLFDYKVGEHVRKFKVGPDRIGHVIVTGKSLEEAEQKLEKVMSRVSIKVD